MIQRGAKKTALVKRLVKKNTSRKSDFPSLIMHSIVRIPGSCPNGGRRWDAEDMRPLAMDDPRVRALFAAGGALNGKKRFAYPIRSITADGQVDLFLPGDEFPLPRTKHHEAMFTLALIHTLGWPDAAHHGMLADAVYHDARLMLECDEAQHYDADHFFNRLPGKQTYQSPRDWRVTLEFLRREYSVCRVRACDYSPVTKRWFDVAELDEVYRRTVVGVNKLIDARKRQLSIARRPVMMVWPDSDDQALAKAVFFLDKLNEELQFAGNSTARPSFVAATQERLERADRLKCATPRPTITLRSRLMVPSEDALLLLLPSKAAGEQINAGDTSSQYARYWRAQLESYDSKQVLIDRSTEMRMELARRNIIPATLAQQQ